MPIASKELDAQIYAAVDTEVAAIKTETDQIGTIVNTGGTATLGAVIGDAANSSIIARLSAIKAKTDNLPSDPADASDIANMFQGGDNSTNRVAGKPQMFTKAVTSAANAGDVTIATVTTQPCYLKSIVVHSDGATTADLTSIAVLCGASKVVTLIDVLTGVKANIDAQDKQVAWTGSVYLPATATIVMTLTGTGATAVDLNCVIEYTSTVNGGYLA